MPSAVLSPRQNRLEIHSPCKTGRRATCSIAEWTFQTFGPRQADAYEKDLIQCCERIAGGMARRQSCTALVDGIDKDLFFTRAGQHFVAFLERKDEVIIVDFLHSRSNLPAKLRHIEDRKEKNRPQSKTL